MLEVFNYLKIAEGGPDTPCMVRTLRTAGIKTRLRQSIYVGHVALLVERGKKLAARTALRKNGFSATW
jgi:hypothetical protein